MTFDHGDHVRLHPVDGDVGAAAGIRHHGNNKGSVAIDQRHREPAVAVLQRHLPFGALPLPELEHPCPKADRLPAIGPPRRMGFVSCSLLLLDEDGRDRGTELEFT